MNFDDAIKAHTMWKIKLDQYLAKPDQSLNAADVESDCKCQLGQWIYAEGKQYQMLPEFGQLKTSHAQFHKAAAEVVRKADSGANVSQEVALGASSPFAKASNEVVRAIMQLRSKTKL